MKNSIIFVVVLITLTKGQKHFLPRHGLPPADPVERRAEAPIWRTILQRQDNFDKNNNNVWNMRYLENGQFFTPGGPIFIMLGAEWSIDVTWLQSGQMYEMAKIHRAHMFYTEHRYYGSSYPTGDLSSDSLRFLTTDQALADFANFIIHIKKHNKHLQKSKVVVFGGSYGGSLALWMRQMYPDLVHAAVSSSAPLLAKVDFNEYQCVVQRSLGPNCASVITRGVEEAVKLLSMGYAEKLRQDFNFCWAVDTNNLFDVNYFFSSLASQIGNEVQYADTSTIPNMCYQLQNPGNMSNYDRLAKYLRNTQDCRGNYKHLVGSISNTSLYNGNTRQWIYQSCTQYGYFQTSWNQSDLYSSTVPIEFYHKWCLDFFGPLFTAQITANGVANTNLKYGALNPNVTRVVSVHGTIDPWSEVGLHNNVNSQAPVIIVPGTSHCADLNGLSKLDPPELYQAKMAVRSYIAQWLEVP